MAAKYRIVTTHSLAGDVAARASSTAFCHSRAGVPAVQRGTPAHRALVGGMALAHAAGEARQRSNSGALRWITKLWHL
jgi:hypothetical protein